MNTRFYPQSPRLWTDILCTKSQFLHVRIPSQDSELGQYFSFLIPHSAIRMMHFDSWSYRYSISICGVNGIISETGGASKQLLTNLIIFQHERGKVDFQMLAVIAPLRLTRSAETLSRLRYASQVSSNRRKRSRQHQMGISWGYRAALLWRKPHESTSLCSSHRMHDAQEEMHLFMNSHWFPGKCGRPAVQPSQMWRFALLFEAVSGSLRTCVGTSDLPRIGYGQPRASVFI